MPRPRRLETFDRFLLELEAAPAPGDAASANLAWMKAFARGRYGAARPVHSRIDRHGVIHDYFRIEEQPALVKQGLSLASAPPAGFLDVGQVGVQFNSKAPDPELAGLTPIRRLTFEDLMRAGSVDGFRHKRHHRSRSQLRGAEAAAPRSGDPGHRWADAWTATPNTGASSTLSIWKPELSQGQVFSLSQIWCVAVGPQGRQTAEIGWHVNPTITGHASPAMFCYWTRDGYATPTSYNGHDNDFVYSTENTVLSVAIEDVCVSDGPQFEVFCAIRLYEGNWWLYVGGDQPSNAVGYFPGSLYEGGPFTQGATEVDFGGEVCGGPPYAPMGSGAFASAGAGRAAYQRNLAVSAMDGSRATALSWLADEADPGAYTSVPATSDDWGDYLYFGGPGGA